MGILENRPFVLRDIMTFLVLEVLSGLEIDGVSQILTLFKNVANGGRTPAVHIFESLILVHALAVLGKVSGRNENFFFLDVYKRQLLHCIIHTLPVECCYMQVD